MSDGTSSAPITLPIEACDYRTQCEPVRARFDRLKAREVALRVEGLGKVFRNADGVETVALRGIDLVTHRREFLCVVGPSGCGKSTFVRILAGLETKSSGTVSVGGVPVSGPGADRGMVFQGYTLFPWLTVKRNVAFGLEENGEARHVAEREALQWLALIGLERFADAYPHQLSGGMRKRVALAQVLIKNPRIILMDEPFSALDIQTRTLMENELLNLWSEDRKSIMFVTHDLEEAISMSDRVILLAAGPGSHPIAEFPIDLERPRDVAEIRHTRAFADQHAMIWDALRAEVLKGYAQSKR